MSSHTSWLDQLNALHFLPLGLKVEDALMVAILLLLYVGFEIIHNVELAETKSEQEAKRRSRIGRLTGG